MTIQEHYIDLSLARTRYLESGTGPALLMLHGMGHSSSADSFEIVMPMLARHYRVIAPDLLGFGKGDRQIEAGPTFDLMLEHLREFMDALGIARANVAGHSMGGWTAAHLAYQSPDRVAKLVLLNAAGLNAQIAPNVGAIKEVPPLAKLAEQARREFRDPSKATDAVVDAIARSRHTMLSQPNALHSLDPLLAIMQSPTLRARTMLHRRLSKITAPALVIWGAGDVMDPYPTWTAEFERLGGEMARSSKPWVIPGARHVLLPTNHYSHWELPEEIARLLGEFLA